MALADDLRADLQAFFSDDALGRAITVRHATAGTYDPSTGSGGTVTTRDYAGRGRLGDYSDYLRTNTAIADADRRVTFIPDDLSFVPMPGDTVIVAGEDPLSIINVKEREIGGVVISYTMQVR